MRYSMAATATPEGHTSASFSLSMLQPRATIGRYEVLDFLGKGGMGEVYRARDLTLNRIVAIKTIRRRDAENPESRLRFEQERRLAATLEHPYICRILDAGSTNGTDYIVMEFLEGESLAHRISAGPLPYRELIGYAIEIASALQYAHNRGIIHRDLKPANVFLTRTGVKLLDFGLAISVPVSATSPDDPGGLSTAMMAATGEGTIVGTAQYLAPERLEGKKADHRSDIWAFGLVMYEMASGQRAFDASTPARQIAAILKTEPPPLETSVAGGSELEWVIRKCLEKDPNERWQAAGDIATVLRRLAGPRPRLTEVAEERRRVGRAATVAAIAAAALLGAVAVLLWTGRDDRAQRVPIALEVAPPLGSAFTPSEGSVQTAQIAVSPDGRSLAFVAQGDDGQAQLWIRPLDSVIARPIGGTAGASFPFWSPDSRSLGFFAQGLLKRVDLTGAPPQMLAAATNGRGGAWNADGVIVFGPNTNTPLSRVDASGGPVAPVTRLLEQASHTSHRWPQFLSDGRRFIYFVRSNDRLKEGIYVGSLDSPESSMIVQASYGGVFAPPDHLLYVADQSLVARRFDVSRARLVGTGSVVTDDVGLSSNFYAAVSVSTDGVLAYAKSAAASELAWVDRSGRRLSVLAPRGRYVDFQLSSDGSLTAVAAVEPGGQNADIRIIDAEARPVARLTAGRATDASPVWSPDGKWIVFRSNRDRVHDLYKRASAGSAHEEPFLKLGTAAYPTDWSSDGRFVVFHMGSQGDSGLDIWAARWENPADRVPLVRTPFRDVQGQLSPDGEWIAYTSDESGDWEVYLQSRTRPELRWQVSVDGGSDPKWRSDSKELCYVSEDDWLMSVTVAAERNKPPSAPARLFALPGTQHVAPYLSAYDIAPDGNRFLVRVALESARSTPIEVVANWTPEHHDVTPRR